MKNQDEFLNILNTIKSTALIQNNSISSDSIKDFFSEMDLSDDDYTSIYNYLAENKITVRGVIEPTSDSDDSKTKEQHLEFYVHDVETLDTFSNKELTELFLQLRNNDETAFQKLTNHFLKTVINIADKYKEHGALLEDLIQEGNIGLLTALKTMDTVKDIDDCIPFIEESIKLSILHYIDDSNESVTLENALIAKSNLVHEAAAYLEKEYGHPAAIDDLSDYTKIPYEEIQDILNLSKK